ncbi:MAG: hypothetical protein J5795_01140 [Lachnospiraceae bacterium]|nr:hypothetical protein [Lachnospiraceae bacterium]
MRDDDDKTLLTVATLAVGALAAFGAFKALADRVEENRESGKAEPYAPHRKTSRLPVIRSDVKVGGKEYTALVDPYDLENVTLTEHVDLMTLERGGVFPTPRKCTDAELREVYKCLWCNEWRTEDGKTLDAQTRGKILTMIDDYIRHG